MRGKARFGAPGAPVTGSGLRMKQSKVCSTWLSKMASALRDGSWKCTMYMLSPWRWRRMAIGSTGARGRCGVFRLTTPATRAAWRKRHLPDDEAAPVVADEDGLGDAQVVEQPHQVGRQLLQVVGLHLGRRVGGAETALVGRDHAQPGVGQRADLVAP